MADTVVTLSDIQGGRLPPVCAMTGGPADGLLPLPAPRRSLRAGRIANAGCYLLVLALCGGGAVIGALWLFPALAVIPSRGRPRYTADTLPASSESLKRIRLARYVTWGCCSFGLVMSAVLVVLLVNSSNSISLFPIWLATFIPALAAYAVYVWLHPSVRMNAGPRPDEVLVALGRVHPKFVWAVEEMYSKAGRLSELQAAAVASLPVDPGRTISRAASPAQAAIAFTPFGVLAIFVGLIVGTPVLALAIFDANLYSATVDTLVADSPTLSGAVSNNSAMACHDMVVHLTFQIAGFEEHDNVDVGMVQAHAVKRWTTAVPWVEPELFSPGDVSATATCG
jgi:hypothetical protein